MRKWGWGLASPAFSDWNPGRGEGQRHTQQEEVILLIRGDPGWNVWALPGLFFTRQETVSHVEIPREEKVGER